MAMIATTRHIWSRRVSVLLRVHPKKSNFFQDGGLVGEFRRYRSAGRYAGALYALAVDSNKVDSIHGELGGLGVVLGESQDLQKLVESPILSRGEQQAAIIAIMKKSGADALTVKFLGTLAANGRLSALPRVIQAFQQEHARRGQVSAEVISAVALDDSRKSSVEKTVARLAGSDKLSLSMRVDPSLIGGLVVRIGSRMVDTSIKTKLSRLETAMKGVA